MNGTVLSGALYVALCASMSASRASAQDAAAGGRAATNQVSEVIVTAQRSNQSLQRVPVSVTPVSGAELATRKLNDLSQITIAVPSLSVGQSNSYSVRGVGSLVQTTNLDASVGVSVDGVSLGVPIVMSNGIFDDVAQVEVLSGPQGLLFGRNASAGLINILSNRPVIGQFGGVIDAELDDRDTDPGGHFGGLARATLNIPVSDTSALRLNFSESYQDPLTRVVNGDPARLDAFQQRTGGRAKFLWDPTSKLSVYLIGDYDHETGIGALLDTSYRVDAGGLNHVGIVADGIAPGPDNLLYGANAPEFDTIDTGGLSLDVSYEFSPALTLSNIAAWRAYTQDRADDFDTTSASIFDTFSVYERYNQFSDELRLAFRPNRFVDGQVGLYGFYQDQNEHQQLLGAVLTPHPNFLGSDLKFDRSGGSIAAFGQANFHLTDKLQLIGGLRVTNDNISIHETGNVGKYIVTLFGPKDDVHSQHFINTNLSYRLGAQYQFDPDLMAYFTYSTGYKGPSFNQQQVVAGQDLTILPETSENYEIGVKTFFLDRRVRLNLSAFLENFDQLQVQEFDASQGTFTVGNAGRARSRGVELSTTVKPLAGLTVNAGATFLDAKFTNFPGDQCYIGQALPSCEASGTFNGAGVRVPNSARFTSSLDVLYEVPVDNSTTAFAEGSYYHRSSVNYSTSGAPALGLPAVDTLGLSTGLEFSKGIRVAIFCKNCTDQHVPSSLYFDSVDSLLEKKADVKQTWNYNSVRTIGVSASYKF